MTLHVANTSENSNQTVWNNRTASKCIYHYFICFEWQQIMFNLDDSIGNSE